MRSGPISKLVDKQSIDDFRQKGVTVLRGAFTGWVDVLRAGIDANMNDPDPNARIYKGENGNGRFLLITAIGTGLQNIRILSLTLMLHILARR